MRDCLASTLGDHTSALTMLGGMEGHEEEPFDF